MSEQQRKDNIKFFQRYILPNLEDSDWVKYITYEWRELVDDFYSDFEGNSKKPFDLAKWRLDNIAEIFNMDYQVDGLLTKYDDVRIYDIKLKRCDGLIFDGECTVAKRCPIC